MEPAAFIAAGSGAGSGDTVRRSPRRAPEPLAPGWGRCGPGSGRSAPVPSLEGGRARREAAAEWEREGGDGDGMGMGKGQE